MKKIFTLITCSLILAGVSAQPLGWNYSRTIAVTENSGASITDYQLAIIFDSQTLIAAGQMNVDASDLRFGTTCSTADLNYWIESGINTPTTKVWVKINSLAASSTSNIYMFYGNTSAITTSAVNGTFFGPNSSTDSVASGGAGGATNSQRGFRFAPNVDILVTDFGKREPNGTPRYVTLFDFVSQAILAQTQVNGPAAQYSYSAITNPIWLTQGTQYLLQLYQGPSDGYYFGTSSQIGQHLTYYDMRYCNSCTQNTFPTSTLTNYHYGYPDMWYYTKNNVTPAPTYVVGGPFSLDLGVDSSYCESVILDAGNPGSTFAWNTLEATQTITVTSSGTYGLVVTTPDNCVATDSIDIVINPNPTVYLGADASYCTGTTLDAGAGYTYLWNDLSTNQTLNVGATGTYSAQITDANLCSASDTILITVFGLPNVSGAATPSVVCYGDTVDFEGFGALSYAWNNGVINGLNPVTISGDYIVVGTDVNDCSNSDTVNIVVNSLPTVDFSFATDSVCSSASVLSLSGGTPAGGIYSGSGVTGSNFDPAVGVGSYVITYTYTDGNSCVNNDTENILVSPCLGMDEMIFGEVSIFPNPTTGLLNIQISNFLENTQLNVFDMLGKTIMNVQLQNNQSTLQLNGNPGMYILEIRNGNKFLRRQITIQ